MVEHSLDLSNINRILDGVDMLICPHCAIEKQTKKSLSSHQNKCPSNPNRNYKNGMTGKTAWNKGKTASNNESVRRQSETLSSKYKDGLLSASGAATREWIDSEKAKSLYSTFGGYREHAGISKKFKVTDSFGNQVTLQSSYELECSKILDQLGIKWNRPKALKYDGRNYFADFFLPELDIWLDPKNEFKAKQDEEKIKKVIEQNNVKLLIVKKENLTIDGIKELLNVCLVS